MAQNPSDFGISAFECDVLRNAFKKSVIEENIPQYRWRSHARLLVSELTDHEHVDSDALDWLVRK